jgi:hypothetical protein
LAHREGLGACPGFPRRSRLSRIQRARAAASPTPNVVTRPSVRLKDIHDRLDGGGLAWRRFAPISA